LVPTDGSLPSVVYHVSATPEPAGPSSANSVTVTPSFAGFVDTLSVVVGATLSIV
jgi:hypothetical protein